MVLSSAFESSVGLAAYAQLAASFPAPAPAQGLATADWFVSDLTRKPLLLTSKCEPAQATSAREPLQAASACEPAQATSAREPVQATSTREPVQAPSAPGGTVQVQNAHALLREAALDFGGLPQAESPWGPAQTTLDGTVGLPRADGWPRGLPRGQLNGHGLEVMRPVADRAGRVLDLATPEGGASPGFTEMRRSVSTGQATYSLRLLAYGTLPNQASVGALPDQAGVKEGNVAGPPVIFLHGFLGDAEDWRAVMAGVGTLRPCVAVDLPGHGGTHVRSRASSEREGVDRYFQFSFLFILPSLRKMLCSATRLAESNPLSPPPAHRPGPCTSFLTHSSSHSLASSLTRSFTDFHIPSFRDSFPPSHPRVHPSTLLYIYSRTHPHRLNNTRTRQLHSFVCSITQQFILIYVIMYPTLALHIQSFPHWSRHAPGPSSLRG